MNVHGLPMDWPENCVLSGTGRWSGPTDLQLRLILLSPAADNTCKLDDYPGIEVAGRSKPYRLYWVIGDPDSGTGVWLAHRP